MEYFILKLLHVIGFILLGSGLVGAVFADFRTRQTDDPGIIAEATRYMAIFYDGVVVPGAILTALSGLYLVFHLDLGFLETPWLSGMWMLSAFEAVEGNIFTRLHIRRRLKLVQASSSNSNHTTAFRVEMEKKMPTFTHFLDLPIFFLIVSLGIFRPLTWGSLLLGVFLAIISALILMAFVPRFARRMAPKGEG